jgi:phthiocerol/phenolphthiocerol synthesis type-I polyketide synthase C
LYLFVLLGSVAVILSELTSAAYVATNAAIDAIARNRRLAGLPGLAVHFSTVSSFKINSILNNIIK